MQITYPLGLWGLLLAIPIIILHFTRPAARQVTVSTMMFWDQVLGEQNRGTAAARGRPLEVLSLLVQLTILVSLVGALIKPYLGVPLEGTTALVIDNSMSMTAGQRGDSPLKRAKSYAKQLVGELEGEVTIFTADRRAPISMGPTGEERALLPAIGAIEATADASLTTAIDLAQQFLEAAEPQMIVLTDNTNSGLGALSPYPTAKVRTFPASVTDNVAITRFTVRRSLVDPIDFEVLVEVTNHGKIAAEFDLEITLADLLIDVIPLQLEPGSQWQQIRSYASSLGGELVARARVNDALAADNEVTFLLQDCKTLTVVVVGPRNYFLEQALTSIPQVDVWHSDDLPEVVPQHALVIFHQIVPARLPDRHVLLVDPLDDFEHAQVGGLLKGPIIAQQKDGGLFMAHLQLVGLTMEGARAIDITDQHERLATTTSGWPIYASIDRDNHWLLVLSTNLAESELPRRTAFPILMSNIVSACQQGAVPAARQDRMVEVLGVPPAAFESNLEPFDRSDSVNTLAPLTPKKYRPPLWILLGLLAFAALAVEGSYDCRRSGAR